jgi:hypothetical protein
MRASLERQRERIRDRGRRRAIGATLLELM